MLTALELSEDHYNVLGLNKFATQEQIKKAYKKLVIVYHPDKNIDNQQESIEHFRKISLAYENLTDDQKRRQYDSSYYKIRSYNNLNSRNDEDYAKYQYHNIYKNASHRYYSRGQDMLDSILKGKNIYKNLHMPNQNKTKTQNLANISKNNVENLTADNETKNLHSSNNKQQVCKSISTVVRIINGKIKTIKKTIIKNKDGRKQILQQLYDGQKITKNMYGTLFGSNNFENQNVKA